VLIVHGPAVGFLLQAFLLTLAGVIQASSQAAANSGNFFRRSYSHRRENPTEAAAVTTESPASIPEMNASLFVL
jgi:hypothetical protein